MNSDQWLHRHFTDDELALLSDRLTAAIDPGSDLVGNLRAWWEHVAKFEADLSAPPDDRGVWGAHDYVAALYVRDRVSRLLPAESDRRKRVEAAVAEVDQRFKDFTEPDAEQCAERIDGRSDPHRGWWWRRIPRKGPVREEISAYYRPQ